MGRSKKGIACIYGIYNTVNKRVYVGQTNNRNYRWYNHRRDLNRGKHRNRFLQRAWNKYGSAAFEFNTLEVIPTADKKVLAAKENFWKGVLEELGFSVYNIAKIAESTLGVKYTEEGKKNVSSGLKEAYNENPELREKVRAQKSKEWPPFVGPDGTVYEGVVNLDEFCRQHGLEESSLYLIFKGKTRFGYRSLETAERVKYSFIDKNGTIYRGSESLEKISKQFKVSVGSLWRVHAGEVKSACGVTLYTESDNKLNG